MKQTLPSLHKPAWLLVLLCVVMSITALAQPATYSIPFAIGRNNCGGSGGTDSVYFFNYTSPNLTNNYSPRGCLPLLKTNYAPLNGYTGSNRPFSIFNASVSFNPKDQNMYYVFTDYNIPAPYKSYIWRWDPTTCPTAAPGLDTLRTFNFDIGGISFDANGKAWQLEFSGAAPYKSYLRQLDFVTGSINGADTLDLIPGAGGIGDTLYNVGSGDITITPDGQMYFIFDNKLYTPDYGSYNNPTHHLKCTYIDTVRRPTGATSLVGLSFADGDLIASYTGTCIYRRVNPVTGDTAALNYTYPSAKGVRATDMSQINSGVGAAKKLVSVTPTGTAQQYDVVYDVYVKNYGNTPIRNLQITDNLGAINGPSNVSLNSVTMLSVPPPPGIALNPGFNGVGNQNLLAATGQVLPAVPIDSNNFVIRISCRLSNIQNGVIYNNQVVVTGNGFNNFALRDSSTNGTVPDLNTNDKPDDLGESQPTPFIVIITPSVPPCATLSQVLYTQDFGTGIGLFNTLPPVPTASTTYAGTTTAPLTNNRFAITDRAQRGDLTNWIPLNDNTPADVDGRMMIVNADAPAGYFYRDTLSNLCPNQQYSFSFYAAFIGNATYNTLCSALGGTVYPRVKCRVRDRATGLVITEASTATISNTSWQQFGIKWVMPGGYSNIIFELINDAAGGCGNDIAIDDIQFGVCSAMPVAALSTATSGCIGGSTTFTASLASAADSAVIPGVKDFQWQISTDGVSWSNIGGANAANFVINPLNAGDVNMYYRVLIAAQGNIGTPGCRYASPAFYLTAKAASTPATSINTSRNNICPGDPITLRLNGGSLGTGASWSWYTGSCGGTLVGTGTSITVNPIANTTYYVRANGDCGPTACVPISIKVDCDIDDDDDGIPDVVESLGVDPLNDSDLDGLEDYRDPSYPGYVDANSDGINDNFDWDRDGIINELDKDSDNDGIPDVVEAYGVDANGDGTIDNYTDTDADGFSQNVDANTSGHTSSGAGLSLPDLDGDGIPNYFDLDSDNDGIPDIIEAGGTDANNNGLIDGIFIDFDNDGFYDLVDGNIILSVPLLRTGADVTSDGRADSYPNKNFDSDRRSNPYDPDSDGDGIADVIEAGFPDANLDGYVDAPYNSKGWATSIAARATLGLSNREGVGNPDYLDIDADGDGIPDNIEGQTTNGYTFPAYTDTDGDGLDNAYDNRPLAFGGSGIFAIDTDLDGTPDFRDLDTDADGLADIVEGNDFNRNGFADDNVSLTGLDTDNDGLENRFDSSNSTIKGTSYNMGTGGSTIGDAAPGSRSPVQKTNPIQTDRDWRYVGLVLPVQFLNFTGTVQSNLVPLSWSIITSKEIDRFEIERSTDNVNYVKVGVNNQPVILNESQGFGYTDNITGISNEILYYRLKVIGKNGEVKYSNILVLRRTKSNTTVAIMPNPASNYLSIRIYAEKDADMDVRIIDNIGRTVLVHRQKVLKGNNTIQLNGLDKFSNGFYSLQLVNNNELITEKLIIQHK